MFKANRGGDLNGFLGAGTELTGDLSFENTFRVDGKITGTIASKGDLLVGEHGSVDGEVRVARCFVSGTVRGLIRTTDRTEITAAGRVHADIETAALIIEDGGQFDGHCSMGRSEASVVSHPSADVVAADGQRSG